MPMACVPKGTTGPTSKFAPGKSTSIGSKVVETSLIADGPAIVNASLIIGSSPIGMEFSVVLRSLARFVMRENCAFAVVARLARKALATIFGICFIILMLLLLVCFRFVMAKPRSSVLNNLLVFRCVSTRFLP